MRDALEGRPTNSASPGQRTSTGDRLTCSWNRLDGMMPATAAAGRSPARSTQWPEFDDVPAVLGDRHEVGRQQQPAVRMRPPDQRLGADDACRWPARRSAGSAAAADRCGDRATQLRSPPAVAPARRGASRPGTPGRCPRPRALAAYMAVSASRSSRSAVVCPRRPKHTPMLAAGPDRAVADGERLSAAPPGPVRRSAAPRPRPRPATGWRTRRRRAGPPCPCPGPRWSAGRRPRPGSGRRRCARARR